MDEHDSSNYRSQEIEDRKFLTSWDVERSYAGAQRPLIEHKHMTPQERLEALQEPQTWREGDRDPRIDMERIYDEDM